MMPDGMQLLSPLPALVLATLGNTLGGMVTYYMGRLLPQHLAPEKSALARRQFPGAQRPAAWPGPSAARERQSDGCPAPPENELPFWPDVR